ncbi:MAG: hypothetical protein QNK04_34705 [Myxococcota bacterium]|nr:hypothetical protein [Myxococcota bacterium]
MSQAWTADKMRELGERHADLEARGDLEGTMETLVDDPVYEFWPVGRSMRGCPRVRRYYEHLFSSFIPSTRGYKLVDEWVNASSLAQEYEIEVEVEGSVERHRVIGVLYASGPRLGGERIYASERCLRLMLGGLFDELEPVASRG